MAIQSELKVPVKYIGVGETIEDLQKFDSSTSTPLALAALTASKTTLAGSAPSLPPTTGTSARLAHSASCSPAAAVDVLLIDTAGRLHNKRNLMEELRKMNRIVDKEFPNAHTSSS